MLNLLTAANTEYSGSITLDGIEIRDNAELDDAIRRAHLGELIAEHGENYL